MKSNLRILVRLAVFIFCLWLIIHYQKTVGHFELGMMCLGLAGLIALLWEYNWSFKNQHRR